MKARKAEIFYVMIPENNENVFHFFLRLMEEEKILKQEFDMKVKSVVTSLCLYTEEDVMAELWEGENPSERDVEE